MHSYKYSYKRFLISILCLSLAFLYGVPAHGTNAAIEERKEERRDVQDRLGDVRRQLEENEGESRLAEGERSDLEADRDENISEYEGLVNLLQLYEDMIYDSEMALADAERSCEEQGELIKSRIRSMYMNSDGSSLEALLSSRDVTSFLEKLELFTVISKHDNDMLESYYLAREDVKYKQSIQMSVAGRAGEMTAGSRRRIDELNLSHAELEDRIDGLQSDINHLSSLEDDLEAQSAELENEIRELVAKAEAEAAAKAAAEKAAKAAKEKAALEAAEKAKAQKASSGSGFLSWPLPGYRGISSGYGNRTHPIKKTKQFHSGIDIPAASGSNINAARGGTVIISGVKGGYGNTVVIDHGGGVTTLYGHCSKLLVKSGQKVQAGSTIAKVGSTGVSTGPHLHFEVRKDGAPVNPHNYL